MSKADLPKGASAKSMGRRISANAAAIREYNASILPSSQLIACAILFLPLMLSLFVESMKPTFTAYAIAFFGCALQYLVFRHHRMRQYALAGFYALFALIYMLAMYLSIVRFADRTAASVMSLFFIMPILFLDRPLRLYTIVAAMYLVHTALGYAVKGADLSNIDIVNCFISVMLGMLIGWMLLRSRLDTFEARRQLTLEKETDVLTGLKNRRKLFETLELLRSAGDELPSCVLMLDIDHFKRFNDRWGHGAGDVCLGHFGALLLTYEASIKIGFFRYGGEEFVALLYGCTKDGLAVVAQDIRKATQRIKTGADGITVSIGTVYCSDKRITNYETWIDRADQAAFAAKAAGRNTVVCWNDMDFGKAAI
ncbi:MAG: GGDEF domain-containing protein [Christensenellales bacterium]